MALHHWELLILTAKPTGLQAQTIHSWFDSCANQQNWTAFFMPHFSSTTSLPLFFLIASFSIKIFETHHTHQVQYFQPTHTGHISAILHRIAYGMDVGPTAQQQRHGPRIHLSDTPPKFNMAPEKLMVGRQAFPIWKVYFDIFRVFLLNFQGACQIITHVLSFLKHSTLALRGWNGPIWAQSYHATPVIASGGSPTNKQT